MPATRVEYGIRERAMRRVPTVSMTSTSAGGLQELESRAQHEYVSSFGIALIYDALGEKEPALSAFERAYQDRPVELSMAPYPPFKTIASDSRFQTRMNTIGRPR